MTNWSYGTGVLPSEQLQESQGTGNVKGAINAISSAYETYKAYMMKAKDQNGNIIDPKSLDAAKKSLETLRQAVTNVKNVLEYYEDGLVIGNKKMGGGLNKDILKNLIGSCEKTFNTLYKQLLNAKPQQQAQAGQPAQDAPANGLIDQKDDQAMQKAGINVKLIQLLHGLNQQQQQVVQSILNN